jgi:hypothetical protein
MRADDAEGGLRQQRAARPPSRSGAEWSLPERAPGGHVSPRSSPAGCAPITTTRAASPKRRHSFADPRTTPKTGCGIKSNDDQLNQKGDTS